jgi:uncharacterized protein (DUF427 family)
MHPATPGGTGSFEAIWEPTSMSVSISVNFTIVPGQGFYAARAGGAVFAETKRALILTEQGHDPVVYFPREDAGMEFLDPSETRTTSPHKGEATHYHMAAKSGRIDDVAWSYETPLPGAEAIAGYVAFYPSKVTVEGL